MTSNKTVIQQENATLFGHPKGLFYLFFALYPFQTITDQKNEVP